MCYSCKKMSLASKEKKAEYNKKYREANKEKIAEYNKKYREANKDKIAEQKKKYNQENKDKIAEKRKQKYREQKEEELVDRLIEKRSIFGVMRCDITFMEMLEIVKKYHIVHLTNSHDYINKIWIVKTQEK